MPELDDLRLLEDAVRAGGNIARKFYGGDYKRWSKEGGSPVTEADLAVNRYLCETLMAARTDYGWLSEESADDPTRLSRRHVFVVDPIDGTVAFLKNRPHFTICAAVVVDGRPCCGAIYNPISDELYSARSGDGARRNGVPIHVTARETLAECAMLGDRTQLTRAPWPMLHVQNRNSVAYRLMLVADVILHEAGGFLTDAQGTALRYNGASTIQPSLVAANPALHAGIIALLRQ